MEVYPKKLKIVKKYYEKDRVLNVAPNAAMAWNLDYKGCKDA